MHRLCTDVSALVVTLSVAMEDGTIGRPDEGPRGPLCTISAASCESIIISN